MPYQNMNLNLEQLRAMADLFIDAEVMVELYWDTDNGESLSRSLERARMAFPRLQEELHELNCQTQSLEFLSTPVPSHERRSISKCGAADATGLSPRFVHDSSQGPVSGNPVLGAVMSGSSASAEKRMTAEHSGRLVIDAECTTCGSLGDEGADGISAVQLALAHTAATGHVVILNGTTDLPDADNPSLSATPSADD